MEKRTFNFEGVTLLITHYNRSASLERLLSKFKELNCNFEDIVVSDDASQPEHMHKLNELEKKYNFRLVSTPNNKGLGNNLNKGQDAVITPYTLYVQEDFIPQPEFPLRLLQGLDFMNQSDSLDIVRFYAYFKYPYLRPFTKDFSEMYISLLALNYKKIFYYCDHPHLRRSSFLKKFGRYAEGVKGDQTEYRMCISFIQKKGKGLFYNDYKSLFSQVNSAEEPSTMIRKKSKMNKISLIKTARDILRDFKYNLDIFFLK